MTTSARREQLADLDKLTDQFEPLLKRMAASWRQVELDLGGRRKQVSTCPTCGASVANLLVASCPKPACVRASNDADAALDLRCED